MTIDIYSDFVCPWCYMGHARLERAIAGAARRPPLTRRSFQLAPDDSVDPSMTAAEAMRGWYPSPGEAEERMARIVGLGRQLGLEINMHRSLPVNTAGAHQLSHMASDYNAVSRLHDLIFHAYHTLGLNIADKEILIDLGTEAGMPRSDVEMALDTGRYAHAVEQDRLRGQQQGVTGVPKIVVDGGSPVTLNDDRLLERLFSA